jgi:hypothetical protein
MRVLTESREKNTDAPSRALETIDSLDMAFSALYCG